MRKRFAHMFVNAFLFVIVLAQLGHCQTVAYIQNLGRYAGVTICSEENTPVVLIVKELKADSVTLGDVRSHEGVHVKQVTKYPGGCVAFVSKYEVDPEFRYQTELEAYCDSMKRAVSRGTPRTQAVIRLAAFMERMYPTRRPSMEVLANADSC